MTHSARQHVKQHKSHVGMFETYGSSSFPAFIFYDISFFFSEPECQSFFSRQVSSQRHEISAVCLQRTDVSTWTQKDLQLLLFLGSLRTLAVKARQDWAIADEVLSLFFFLFLEELSNDWKQRREQAKSLCNCSNCSSAPATIPENKLSFKMHFFLTVYRRLGHAFLVWCMEMSVC